MAGDNDRTIKFKRKRAKRAITSIIDEMLAEAEWDQAIPTQKERRAFCKYCETMVLAAPSVTGFMEKHNGPCGLPCLSGGVPVGTHFHCDRCPICNSPDVFPEGTRVP